MPPSLEGKSDLFFKSALLGTYLALSIQPGHVMIKTDNLSVLAIMKDSFTGGANARKMKVNVEDAELDFTSIDYMLGIIHPMVQR